MAYAYRGADGFRTTGRNGGFNRYSGRDFFRQLGGSGPCVFSDDGHLLWQYDTMRDFQTVNGVKAKGGSMAAPGPTVVDGMVFVGSGYTFTTGIPGNVLLAFSPQ